MYCKFAKRTPPRSPVHVRRELVLDATPGLGPVALTTCMPAPVAPPKATLGFTLEAKATRFPSSATATEGRRQEAVLKNKAASGLRHQV